MGRLQKGEMAASKAAEKRRNRTSVKHVINLTMAAFDHPEQAAPALIEACASKKLLAQLDNQKLGMEVPDELPENSDDDGKVRIMPMVFNTFKNHVDSLFPGGWEAFKRLCDKVAVKAASSATKPGSRDHLQQQNKDKDETIAELNSQIFLASAQYLDLFRRFKDMAELNPILQTRIKEHVRKHATMFPGAERGFTVIRGGRHGEGNN